jgi:acetyltransferase-like isoleucine patch superfamily enzyme
MSIFTKDQPQFKNDPHTEIGDWTYGNFQIARAYDPAISKLKIGKFCSLGAGIQMVYYGSHQLYDITTYPFNMLHGQGWPPVHGSLVNGQNIYIGNDVYIGNHATIMQGAYIEDGAVIGAYSIIKGHVKAYNIVVGNPGHVKKKRFEDEQIKKLLEMKWWDWPIETIKSNLQMISSPNIEALYNIWRTEIK